VDRIIGIEFNPRREECREKDLSIPSIELGIGVDEGVEVGYQTKVCWESTTQRLTDDSLTCPLANCLLAGQNFIFVLGSFRGFKFLPPEDGPRESIT